VTILGKMAEADAVDRSARDRWAARDLAVPARYRLEDRVRLSARRLLDATLADVRARLGAVLGERSDAGSGNVGLAIECIAQARQDWLEERLDTVSARQADRIPAPLTEARRVAREARPRILLSRGVAERIIWGVAAEMGRHADGPRRAALSRTATALTKDAVRGVRPEEVAVRSAEGMDPVADHVLSALTDACVPLAAALLARGAALSYEAARDLLLHSGDALLWVALRRAGAERSQAAAIAALLRRGEAHGDWGGTADAIDRAYGAIDPDALLEPLRVSPEMQRMAGAR